MSFLNGGSRNTYVFKDEDFTTLFKTEQGSLKVLKKFAEKSRLFKGIENYRVLIYEAYPMTFLTPGHWDSDITFFVGQGKGTVSLVFEDRRESYNIEKGHLMTIPAGIIFYMTNSDEHERMVLSMFVISIANPGDFVPFFSAGSQDADSFLSAFSPEILETAFNASNDKLQRIFYQQRKGGVIVTASKEQINALTADTNYSKGKFGPCQILSFLREINECGKLFMVNYNEYEKLQDLNMFISFCVLSQGCMNSPFHSARATKIIMVVKGSGRFEMVGLGQGEEEGSTGTRYEKISSELRPGMVFVVPPGHSMVLMASKDDNMETICYEVNAKGNMKCTVAGKVNMMKNFHGVAKELAFSTTSAEEVDKVLYGQENDFFLKGPNS